MLAFKMCDFASGSRVETVRQCVDSKAFSTFSTSSCSNFISSEAGSAESSQFLKCAPASMHSWRSWSACCLLWPDRAVFLDAEGSVWEAVVNCLKMALLNVERVYKTMTMHFRSWLLPINSQIAWFVPCTFKARTRCHFDVFHYLASWTCTGHVTGKASRKHSSDACYYGHVIPMAYSRHPAVFMPSRLDAGQDLLVPPIMCPNHLNTGNHMQLKWDSKQMFFS